MIFPRSRSKKALSRQAGYPTKPTTASTVIRPCSVNAGRLAFQYQEYPNGTQWYGSPPVSVATWKHPPINRARPTFRKTLWACAARKSGFRPIRIWSCFSLMQILHHNQFHGRYQPCLWKQPENEIGYGIRLYEWCPILSPVPLSWHHSLATRVSTIRPNGITNPTTDRQD